MNSRIVDGLRLSCAGVLVGCGPGQSTDDDGAGEETSEDTGNEGGPEACGDVEGGNQPGPPRLVSARLDGDLLVRLTFTEPLASVGGIDPASFRISWPFHGAGYGSYVGYTAYYDPMALLCGITDYCTGEYTEVVEIGCAADDPAALLLRLEGFRADLICPLFAQDDSALLLPHFDASLGAITDLDGEALASLGAHWVQVPDVYTEVDGEYPNYGLRVPIECPP